MLIDNLKNEITSSLKKGDAVRVETIRFLVSAVRYFAIDKYGNEWETKLTDTDVLEVIKKQVKTHKESIEAYNKAGRSDLVEKEQKELEILQTYLPAEISDEELKNILIPIIKSGEKNFGLLMKQSMAAVSGKAEGARVSAMIKILQNQ